MVIHIHIFHIYSSVYVSQASEFETLLLCTATLIQSMEHRKTQVWTQSQTTKTKAGKFKDFFQNHNRGKSYREVIRQAEVKSHASSPITVNKLGQTVIVVLLFQSYSKFVIFFGWVN